MRVVDAGARAVRAGRAVFEDRHGAAVDRLQPPGDLPLPPGDLPRQAGRARAEAREVAGGDQQEMALGERSQIRRAPQELVTPQQGGRTGNTGVLVHPKPETTAKYTILLLAGF
ncbi:hypothetical protein GCM10023096_60630 [Nonomuraea ferruginea]